MAGQGSRQGGGGIDGSPAAHGSDSDRNSLRRPQVCRWGLRLGSGADLVELGDIQAPGPLTIRGLEARALANIQANLRNPHFCSSCELRWVPGQHSTLQSACPSALRSALCARNKPTASNAATLAPHHMQRWDERDVALSPGDFARGAAA